MYSLSIKTLNKHLDTWHKKYDSFYYREWQETVYDLIRDIRDPEKPETLEGILLFDKNEYFSNMFLLQRD